jgi:hypothetical protein
MMIFNPSRSLVPFLQYHGWHRAPRRSFFRIAIGPEAFAELGRLTISSIKKTKKAKVWITTQMVSVASKRGKSRIPHGFNKCELLKRFSVIPKLKGTNTICKLIFQ